MEKFLSEWETTTYNRIETTIEQDLSDSVLYYRKDMTLCNGDTYFVERCIEPRNNLMNSILPILICEIYSAFSNEGACPALQGTGGVQYVWSPVGYGGTDALCIHLSLGSWRPQLRSSTFYALCE
jgi:hypothetical protein